MSRKGNPYDNAACESFMKTLKYEEVYRQEYRDLAEARASHRAVHRERSTTASGCTRPWAIGRRSSSNARCLPFRSTCFAAGDRMKNEGALRMRFSRHGGIYRSDVSSLLVTPGPEYRFPVGPGQGIGHAGKNMPCPSSAMSSGRLFLDGLLASIARLRFTGIIRLKLLPLRRNHLSSNGKQSLNCLSQPRGQPQVSSPTSK